MVKKRHWRLGLVWYFAPSKQHVTCAGEPKGARTQDFIGDISFFIHLGIISISNSDPIENNLLVRS